MAQHDAESARAVALCRMSSDRHPSLVELARKLRSIPAAVVNSTAGVESTSWKERDELRTVKPSLSDVALGDARPLQAMAVVFAPVTMALPLSVTFPPMEAQLVDELPRGGEWLYEPKWDGFRCLAFKDGSDVDLRSKSGQPFNRYFPEIVAAVQALGARRCVLDGELVVPEGSVLSFDELLQRIHPAKSRVDKLAREHPALFIVFDMLVDADGKLLVDRTLPERRRALENFFSQYRIARSPLHLSPQTQQPRVVARWLDALGSGLDGLIAKRRDLGYESGNRHGMQKFKRMRTADCVVGGFRYAAKERTVGSLLLGLYDDDGLLHHVGFAANLKSGERAALTRRLEKLIKPPGFTGRAPGGPSRWSTERSGAWEALSPKLVAEVQYDHFSGDRFRHGTRFLRWRPDKPPQQCLMSQVEQEAADTLGLLRKGGKPAKAVAAARLRS